jgi:hypothetical protein
MPLFDVVVTTFAFKKQADDTQIKVEKLILSTSVIASSVTNAVLLAAKKLPPDADDEVLGQATVSVKQV